MSGIVGGNIGRSSGSVEAADNSIPQGVARGGTGAATHTANNVLIGAGTSALTSIAPGSDGQVLTSTGSVWQSEAAATSHTGHVIQYDSSLITTVTSTDVAIPSDNTKPQITEGATMVSLAFTPLFAGSTLEILVNVGMDSNESSNLALCLFNTAIHATDAVVVAASRTGGGLSQSMTILHNYTTPSTATATWQVRYGGHYGIVKIGQTNSFNYGSIMQYGITIKEIKV